MIIELMSDELEYLYDTDIDEMEGKQSFSKDIIKQYKRKVDILVQIEKLSELNNYSSLNFEKLKSDLKGYYSIRLNKQYRLIFRVEKTEKNEISIQIIQVTEISKHYE